MTRILARLAAAWKRFGDWLDYSWVGNFLGCLLLFVLFILIWILTP